MRAADITRCNVKESSGSPPFQPCDENTQPVTGLSIERSFEFSSGCSSNQHDTERKDRNIWISKPLGLGNRTSEALACHVVAWSVLCLMARGSRALTHKILLLAAVTAVTELSFASTTTGCITSTRYTQERQTSPVSSRPVRKANPTPEILEYHAVAWSLTPLVARSGSARTNRILRLPAVATLTARYLVYQYFFLAVKRQYIIHTGEADICVWLFSGRWGRETALPKLWGTIRWPGPRCVLLCVAAVLLNAGYYGSRPSPPSPTA